MSEIATHKNTGRRIRIRGLVQGVGFRPTVWNIAREHGLHGQVLNDGEGVLIDAVGISSQLDNFVSELVNRCPPLARIDHIEQEQVEMGQYSDFQIVESLSTAAHTAVVPDAATCHSCLEEIFALDDRRYRYPFSNCTHCGPRLSIIEAIPYDRANTSMSDFSLCPECRTEYQTPSDRRFHAQPNACPVCGPAVWLHPPVATMGSADDIDAAHRLLLQGEIIAIKGIGGFHLACDATNATAVSQLRRRKRRYAKPFALMARDLDVIRRYCKVTEAEASLLSSTAAPIVLMDLRAGNEIAADVVPGQHTIGFMLPYTPLHHLLLEKIDHPLVMTSGNLSDIPQCTDNDEAIKQLQGVADHWLLHNREIVNRIDDSVTRIVFGRPQLLRRARGYAPASMPLPAGFEQAPDLLAYGAELKNTFCLIKDGQAVLSQHMGDLEETSTYIAYKKNLTLYQQLFNHQPAAVVIDAHPDYLSSKFGREQAGINELPLIEVQHHHAHIAACLAENNWPLDGGKVLGIALDGIGFGEDETFWGGEFLFADYSGFERLAKFSPVALMGGSQAMHQPWRNTYAHLMHAFDWESLDQKFPNLPLLQFLREKPRQILDAMLRNKVNAPLASSCGRLFDAVAAAIGICRDEVLYEGQAAMEMESLVTPNALVTERANGYQINISNHGETEIPCFDFGELWQAILQDLQSEVTAEIIASRFHLGLIEAIVNMVEFLTADGEAHATTTIVLSGGVFQNRIMLEQVAERLIAKDYGVLWHTQVPANDGGIALGQAVVALARLVAGKEV